MEYPTRYASHRRMLKQQLNNVEFKRAFNAILNNVKLLLNSAGDGAVYKKKYEEMCGPILIEIEIGELNIVINMKDTTLINEKGFPFHYLHVRFDRIKKVVVKQLLEFPYSCFWNEMELYRYQISSFELGDMLLTSISRLSHLLNTKPAVIAPSKEIKEQTKKDTMKEQIKSHQERGIELFESSSLFMNFQALIASLFYVEQQIDEIKNIEFEHKINRMVFTEIKEVLDLFEKIPEEKRENYAQRYIDVIKSMQKSIDTYADSKSGGIEYEVEKQIKVLELRYDNEKITS